MLGRSTRVQLTLLSVLTVVVLAGLGGYYLRLPNLAGVGQYTLHVDLQRSGGLYPTANVTYRGTTVGKVTAVEPTQRGVVATLSIDNHYRIPVDATANVHSVSAVGEQYVDLVSTTPSPSQFLSDRQTVTHSTVPSPIGPTLDSVNHALAALPADKIASLLDETSQAVGGLGPSLQRLVNATQAIAGDLNANVGAIDDIIDNSGPILNSQVSSGDSISRWAANVRSLAVQSAAQDHAVRGVLQEAAPTARQLATFFDGIHDALPVTLANLEIVLDMLKRYHSGVEQALVFVPQEAAIGQAVVAPYPKSGALDFRLNINQPPPCLTGFLPASQWRSPADTTTIPPPPKAYCKIPKDYQANVVRGARNYPCVDVPGKRAATPAECRSDEPYVPAGTNPWYGDPNQILSCPAPGARCDQGVDPGRVIPAPSINNGMNPLPADQLPPPAPPRSDPLSRPRSGVVQCNGQQPNPCNYIPADVPTAMYTPSSGELVGPDGAKYTVTNSASAGDDGWKDMLSPSGGRHF
jgi:phospholipid/cholesterol/gamma-HCH transport system substrate-binding protein